MWPHTWSRAKPLLNVAGNTIIGHLLNLMSEITTDEVIFVVGYKGDEIETWIRGNYPHLNTCFVVQEEALGRAHAIWMCRDYLGDGEVLVAFGDGIVNAKYAQIPEPDADGVVLAQEVEEPCTFGVIVTDEDGVVTDLIEEPATLEHNQVIAGIYWFRNGRSLLTASQKSKTMLDICKHMMAQNAVIKTKPAIFYLDVTQPDALLEANKRLLGLGYGSEDAVERSYAEEFAVLPPVFIHESAAVSNAIIGPYVNVAAHATVQNAIVRNSIIDAGASVTDCVLDGALIGENARIVGQSRALFVGDDSIVDLG